ncbi:MAG: hypothetical protein LUC94_04340 [Clostridiales bacterium]|nr:hypothetical protein [Clostridiales bacterium]
MEAKDIAEIIQMIPQYIEYVYPGYLLMYLYQFFRGKSIRITKESMAIAVCISYVMKVVSDSIPVNAYGGNASLIGMAVVFSYFAYRFTKSEIVAKILRWLQIYTTFAENEVESLLGYSGSAWLCVYLKGENIVYEGSLGAKELEEDKDRFITLEAYWKYHLDENGTPVEPYIEDYDGDYEEAVVIPYETIKRIEKRNVEKSG